MLGRIKGCEMPLPPLSKGFLGKWPYTSPSALLILYSPSFPPSQSPLHGFSSCSERTHSGIRWILSVPLQTSPMSEPLLFQPHLPYIQPWNGPNILPLPCFYPRAAEHCMSKSPRRVCMASQCPTPISHHSYSKPLPLLPNPHHVPQLPALGRSACPLLHWGR